MARILLIDDEDSLREVLAEVLIDAGHAVAQARDGAAGIAELRRQRPDLVLCDVDMPGLDGYQVLKIVRADPGLASVPFLFLLGLGQLESVRAGMTLGADDYLTKPVSGAELLDAIAVRLARHDAARQDAERRMEELRLGITVLLPHEMRTPLAVVLGSAQALVAMHDSLPPQSIKQLATGMTEAARRLQHMIENYLLYAALELERLAPERAAHPHPTRERAGPDDVREAASALADGPRAADLRLDLEAVAVPMSPAYLRKVVSELAGNALKFSAPGSPVRVSLRSGDGGTRLEVVDAGRGMTRAQIDQVSAFRQFDRAVFEQQGSGLGLALVERIAAAAGAALELSSEPSSGTTARLRWPPG